MRLLMWLGKAMLIGGSPVRAVLSKPTSLAPTRWLRPHVGIVQAFPTKQRAISASYTSPPTKFMARLVRMDFSQNRRPTTHHRLIQHRKLHRIIWPWHGIAPMAFQL